MSKQKHRRQTVWVGGDFHFDHWPINFHCNRGFDNVDDMNDALVHNWNSRVNKGDLMIVVGDLAWKRHRKWCNVLNGSKILVRGNHDKMPLLSLEQFSEVHDTLCRRYSGTSCYFHHYAQRVWPGMYGRVTGSGVVIPPAVHLYAHSHGTLEDWTHTHSIDVGVDVWGLAPIRLDAVVSMVQERTLNSPVIDDSETKREVMRKKRLVLSERNLKFLKRWRNQ